MDRVGGSMCLDKIVRGWELECWLSTSWLSKPCPLNCERKNHSQLSQDIMRFKDHTECRAPQDILPSSLVKM